MPAIVAKEIDKLFHKPQFLQQVERIANGATVKDLQKIAKLLRSGVALEELFVSVNRTSVNRTKYRAADLDHVVNDWLSAKTGWWAANKPANKLRAGLLKVISLRIKHKSTKTRPLPVDYWWLPSSQPQFRVMPLLGPAQLTVMLVTPMPPARASAAAQRRNEKRTSVRKTTRKTTKKRR